MQISQVDAPVCAGGENPLWDAQAQVLYYVDNTGMKVHRYDPESGESRTLEMPNVVTTLALCEGGGAVVTLRSGISLLDTETGALEQIHPLADPPPMVWNDGCVDSAGRFLIGASTSNFDDPQPDGGLFALDPDRTLRQLDGDIHFSNSNCFSPDGRTHYFSDSWTKTIYAYDYDPQSGEVEGRRVFATTEDLGGLPDGATVDSQGRMWVAIYEGSKIAVYRPDGSLERTIAMPVSLVSSVAFGGLELDRLFVTSIAHSPMGESLEEGAGALYVIDGLDATGLPENRYAG